MANSTLSNSSPLSNQAGSIFGGVTNGMADANDYMHRQMQEYLRQQQGAYTNASKPKVSGIEYVIRSMSVEKIANGLLVHINVGGGEKKLFVESIDKLGEAIVTECVAYRIAGEKE